MPNGRASQVLGDEVSIGNIASSPKGLPPQFDCRQIVRAVACVPDCLQKLLLGSLGLAAVAPRQHDGGHCGPSQRGLRVGAEHKVGRGTCSKKGFRFRRLFVDQRLTNQSAPHPRGIPPRTIQGLRDDNPANAVDYAARIDRRQG